MKVLSCKPHKTITLSPGMYSTWACPFQPVPQSIPYMTSRSPCPYIGHKHVHSWINSTSVCALSWLGSWRSGAYPSCKVGIHSGVWCKAMARHHAYKHIWRDTLYSVLAAIYTRQSTSRHVLRQWKEIVEPRRKPMKTCGEHAKLL